MQWKKIITLTVVSLLGSVSYSQDYDIGDWRVVKSVENAQVARVTKDGSTAGVICNLEPEGCFAFLTLDSKCDEGASYPLLLNAATGAFSTSAICKHLTGKLQLLLLREFEKMISAFESGGEVGVVSPMLNGKFKVIRFSTIGATAAIRAVRSKTPKDGTRTKSESKAAEFL